MIEKGIQNLVFKSPEKTYLILKYLRMGLERVKRSGKGLLNIVKRARIMDDVSKEQISVC